MSIALARGVFALWADDWRVEPGAFELHIGSTLASTRLVRVEAQ